MTKLTRRHITSKDSDQPVHQPSIETVLIHHSLDSLEAVKGNCDQQRLRSGCTDVDFVMRWLICYGYSLEVSQQGAANECALQFSCRFKKKINTLWS